MQQTVPRRIVEQLAAKVHEAWMRQRLAQGWVYGPQRNDPLKQHPCLVDFDRLPENEKELDRCTARTTMNGLMELGYEIRLAGSEAPGGVNEQGLPALQAPSPAPLPIAALHT